MYFIMGDTVFTKLSVAHGHLFMGDYVCMIKSFVWNISWVQI